MIVIDKPYVKNHNSKSRLAANIDIDGDSREVWFEVDSQFEESLCYERGDAFVVAILNYAMRHGHDVESRAPIGEDLYYQLVTELIPALANNSKVMYQTKLIADVDSSILPNAGAVGTGISCGVDSFHALAAETLDKFPKHKLTHLAFNNVGSHGEGERALKLFSERKELAQKFCDEFGFVYVEGNSNLHDVIPQNHYLTHTYSSMFSVFALQKLYSVYYYASSGHPYNKFSVKDNEKYASGLYELLSLNCFSSHNLKIYSEGGDKNRFEKIKTVVQYPPSYKYLNVCLKQFHNCGKCEKCVRTLVALDALDKLDEYKNVFDIDAYRANKNYYYKRLVAGTLQKSDMYAGVYPLLKRKISFFAKINGAILYEFFVLKAVFKKVMPKSFIVYLRRKVI